MRLFVMVEPNFKNTTSCEMIFKELKDNLRKKRISYQVVDSPLCISHQQENTYLVLISTNLSLIVKTIAECEAKLIHPIILSFQLLNSIPGIYSSVTPNIEHSMIGIMSFLKNKCKNSPALYGISTESSPDMARMNCFLQKHILPTSERAIFQNKIGLDGCFEEFFTNFNDYDCVICTNNYAAIHLINSLKQRGVQLNDFVVISYGQTHIASKFYPEITTVDVLKESLGKAAIKILEELESNSDILHINMSVKCCVSSQSDMSLEPLVENVNISTESSSDIFYEDPQVQKMLSVEKLLSLCDSTDMLILDLVIKGYSYEQIANISFLSYSAVKYRIRNMLQLCGCSTRSQFVNFMKMYI